MIRPGGQLSAKLLNAMAAAAQTTQAGYVGGVNSRQGPGGTVMSPDIPGLYIVKITEASGNLYGFQEQYDPQGDATYEDNPQGIYSNGVTNPLAALNLSVGDIVVVRLNPVHPERYELISAVLNDTPDRYMGLCHIRDGYGTITGSRETWVRSDGSSYCREVPDCPSGTCSVLWWCDGDGAVFSAPVGDRPDDAVNGPWPTEDMATSGCNPLISQIELENATCPDACNFSAYRYVKGVLRQATTGVVVKESAIFDLLFAWTNGAGTGPFCSAHNDGGGANAVFPGGCSPVAAGLTVQMYGLRSVLGAGPLSSPQVGLGLLGTFTATGFTLESGWSTGSLGIASPGGNRSLCTLSNYFSSPVKVATLSITASPCGPIDAELWIEKA